MAALFKLIVIFMITVLAVNGLNPVEKLQDLKAKSAAAIGQVKNAVGAFKAQTQAKISNLKAYFNYLKGTVYAKKFPYYKGNSHLIYGQNLNYVKPADVVNYKLEEPHTAVNYLYEKPDASLAYHYEKPNIDVNYHYEKPNSVDSLHHEKPYTFNYLFEKPYTLDYKYDDEPYSFTNYYSSPDHYFNSDVKHWY